MIEGRIFEGCRLQPRHSAAVFWNEKIAPAEWGGYNDFAAGTSALKFLQLAEMPTWFIVQSANFFFLPGGV